MYTLLEYYNNDTCNTIGKSGIINMTIITSDFITFSPEDHTFSQRDHFCVDI